MSELQDELRKMRTEVLIDGLANSANDFAKATFVDFAIEMFYRMGAANDNRLSESDVDMIRGMLVLGGKLGKVDFDLIEESPSVCKLWREYTELKAELLARIKKS